MNSKTVARNLTVNVVLPALLLAALPVMLSATVSGPASAHFGFMNTVIDGAKGVIPAVGLLAIVGGLAMWGISGGQEGAMKKLGPVVAAFGVAATILSSSSFFGVGGAGF